MHRTDINPSQEVGIRERDLCYVWEQADRHGLFVHTIPKVDNGFLFLCAGRSYLTMKGHLAELYADRLSDLQIEGYIEG